VNTILNNAEESTSSQETVSCGDSSTTQTGQTTGTGQTIGTSQTTTQSTTGTISTGNTATRSTTASTTESSSQTQTSTTSSQSSSTTTSVQENVGTTTTSTEEIQTDIESDDYSETEITYQEIEREILINDFEAQFSPWEVRSSRSYIKCKRTAGKYHDGSHSLFVNYITYQRGYAECFDTFDNVGTDGAESIVFWMRSNTKGQTVKIILLSGEPSDLTKFEYSIQTDQETKTGWKQFTIDLNDFIRSESSDGINQIDQSRIYGFGIDAPASTKKRSGSVWIDDLTLHVREIVAIESGNDADETDLISEPDMGDTDGSSESSTSSDTSAGSQTDNTNPSTTTDQLPTSNPSTSTTTVLGNTIAASDLQYEGAFRLPGGEDRDVGTFGYGGNGMTFYPSNGMGSLFISGHDKIPYDFPNGGKIAEVKIPTPAISRNVEDLPSATFVQGFRNIDAAGLFSSYDEIPRIGLTYINTTQFGEKIYITYGQHFHEDTPDQVPTHAMFNTDLSHPNTQGAWYVGNQLLYGVNDYMFEIPKDFADTYLGGRALATGRFKDGGWGGQGPQLFAIGPWLSGSVPANRARLNEVSLLHYTSSQADESLTGTIDNYQHPDEYSGGAWLTSGDKSAVVFVGAKSAGTKYWYGWVNPAGTSIPCIETAFRYEFPTCRLANGDRCPTSDLNGCSGHNDVRGWWSERFVTQITFFDPADLARVAQGTLGPNQPQPYATLNIDGQMFNSTVESDMLGTGQQRRYRIGDVTYDRANNKIYILELFADGTKPIVHVWKVR
jgi:hypothetical protein